MKHLYINTKKTEIGSTNNNGFQFPVITGSTNVEFHSTSTNFNENLNQYQVEKINNYYTICLDWMEFICQWNKPIELAYINNNKPNVIIEKISVHRNPNFKNLHRVYLNGVEVCDIYSSANNGTHAYNEVSVKVANILLYADRYQKILPQVLTEFDLTFIRFAKLAIALDGSDLLKMGVILNKWSRSSTIQTNNDSISILPTAFDKKSHNWLSWSIGKEKSGISARIYDKTEEIAQSKKEYINDFWTQNRMPTENIGRFEIQLNYKRLKKYNLDLSSLDKLSDAEFLGAMFKNEVESWLKFYRVRKKDMLNHKKEVAIKKGKEIQIIKWDKLPTKMELLQLDGYLSNGDSINARNTISFNLREILRHPNTSTTLQAEIIKKYASDYNLQDFVYRKIQTLFGSEVKHPYIQILKPLFPDGLTPKDEP